VFVNLRAPPLVCRPWAIGFRAAADTSSAFRLIYRPLQRVPPMLCRTITECCVSMRGLLPEGITDLRDQLRTLAFQLPTCARPCVGSDDASLLGFPAPTLASRTEISALVVNGRGGSRSTAGTAGSCSPLRFVGSHAGDVCEAAVVLAVLWPAAASSSLRDPAAAKVDRAFGSDSVMAARHPCARRCPGPISRVTWLEHVIYAPTWAFASSVSKSSGYKF